MTPCPRCRAEVWAGLDGDVLTPVVVDPRRVDYLAAVCAHLAGRQIFAWLDDAPHPLDDTQLAGGGPRLPLSVGHECAAGMPLRGRQRPADGLTRPGGMKS